MQSQLEKGSSPNSPGMSLENVIFQFLVVQYMFEKAAVENFDVKVV